MPNVGFGEVFMLLVVVLLVVGPAKLPEIARNLGKAYRTFTTEMQKAQETLRVSIDEAPAPTASKPGGGVIDVPDSGGAPADAVAPDVVAAPGVVAAPAERLELEIAEPSPDVGVERRYEDT